MTTKPPTRGINFIGCMVDAIQKDRKTQTRRIFKGFTPPDCHGEHTCLVEDGFAKFHLDGKLAMHSGEWTRCPYGKVGDHLYVRETFGNYLGIKILYRASCVVDDSGERRGVRQNGAFFPLPPKWKSGRYMPRAYSRFELEITSLRVERVQNITREDAIAEGAFLNERDWWEYGYDHRGRTLVGDETPELAFRSLWDTINFKRGFGWLKNPWIWIIGFKRV